MMGLSGLCGSRWVYSGTKGLLQMMQGARRIKGQIWMLTCVLIDWDYMV